MEGMASNKKSTQHRHQHRLQRDDDHDDATKDQEHQALELSVLLAVPSDDSSTKDKKKQVSFKPIKPHRGNLIVGRIHKKSRILGAPSLMLNLRGGFVGRCCITELSDVDSWENMPLGKAVVNSTDDKIKQQRVVSDSDADRSHENDGDGDASDDEHEASRDVQNDYPDGQYVKCRVLGAARSKGTVELSLRDSRLEGGSLDDDAVPNPNETAHAYVVSTTKMGCFVRLSRSVEGRVILKELSDDFIPNPSAMFPPGRLVVGKVKSIKVSANKKNGNQPIISMVDMDMRESVLLASGDRLTIDDIHENSKYTGVITRVESYGVFVRIDNSDVSGLAHVSECSDAYIKNINDLYNPGDLVKIIVVSMDKEQRRLGFSLKASNFVDDDDSDDESTSSSGSESSSNGMEEDSDDDEEKSMDSEDEDFASKLANKMEAGGEGMDVDDEESTDGDDSSEGSTGDSESDSSDDEDESEEKLVGGKSESLGAMDTNVGFDWGATTSSKPTKSSKLASDDESSSSSDDSSEDESDDDDADSGFKSSHKARKKAAAKRKEEEETSRRETALADGTADETPETSADFERLVASSPNSSEVWIKYMAFHLSLADIDSARNVANRAFERIEFRQEGEKLNVWTALLTLELKYGTDKSLHHSVDRACQQNNPKQVYLRVCELLDKEVDASALASGSADVYTATKRADEMFKKMCKKFKGKKSVWLAHFQYLLKGSRHEEAHALLKRSLQSLPTYKHVEVMSKFAQMEFELGSPERGRTIFNALLEKHPKRMDLLFVNIDKEVKNGDIAKARALFDSVVNPVSHDRKFKFSDKQMKSLFKKWFRMEEDHGDEESQELVKEEARAFVGKTNS
mmetsp:Transcript_5874/g.13396  ORF Transcript_5874/g.13396 Transcript_5874/m.13396 type:complete len:857 (-) Transcript_5874:55-2625(-)